MRKTILSLFLVFTFSAYALYTNIIGQKSKVVLSPQVNKSKVALTLPKYNTTPDNSYTNTSPEIVPAPDNTSTSTTNNNGNTNTNPVSTPVPIPKPVYKPVVNNGKYRNGSYTGDSYDAYYGNVQVEAVISGGKIVDVQFLDYPQDRSTSVRINSRAMPYLTSEAISLQDSNVNTVSGASFTSGAFRKSLASALSQARI